MIPVTKPYLPDKEKYLDYVSSIYQRQWLTNNGPLVMELENKIKEFLKVQNLLFVANGTVALQIAIKALDLEGEIITTPFSYVATTSSIVWEGCEPVFVDIDDSTLNIDPEKIEASITERTSAILATHCFGNACDIEAIDIIAKKHDLKVIYDAAHCFGTQYKGKSVFEYGDISTCSLHATKLMHSVEGGLVFTNDAELLERMFYMRNFGHDGPEKFDGVGINGKNSEFHAAMGICVLQDVADILAKRKNQGLIYKKLLKTSGLKFLQIQDGCEFNYAYFPVLFESESLSLDVKQMLGKLNIYPRRYFYPSLNQLEYVKGEACSISEDVASRILCLPVYFDLEEEQQEEICKTILNVLDIE
ncbi:MAG: DegT/DnrJ/EryC1/StrS family aminotransferase [Vicingaceae bacterium]